MGFDFNFTEDKILKLLRVNSKASEWYAEMNEVLPLWEIDTVERVAGFIAQCGHESGSFRLLEENLNYSWQNLRKTFPRYFPTDAKAKAYHRQPEKIANLVYMDKNRTKSGALGNVKEGDGWLFRGRGAKQLTGRSNYAAFGKSVNLTAEEAVAYVSTKKGAIESACWFWKTNNLNSYADRKDIEGMSERVNGGTIGLADRKKRWSEALAVLGADNKVVKPAPVNMVSDNKNSSDSGTNKVEPVKETPVKVAEPRTLNRGDKGKDVVQLQQALGVKADGDFGPQTERALKQWQDGVNMPANGIATPAVLKKLLR